MPMTVCVHDRIETVTLTESRAADSIFDVRVTLKSGVFNTHRMSGGEILREYGAYLTTADRQLLAKGHRQNPNKWWCSLM
jgi:hypothetical protein